MSIPGKVLIALLSALAVAAVASMLDPAQSLLSLLGPTAVAAVLAVVLSHRALPMPGGAAVGSPAPTPSEGASANPASSRAAPRGPQPPRERRKRERNPRNGEGSRRATPPEAAASRSGAAAASAFETGTVKWFNVSKGYGFIIRANGEEIFVHHRSVQGEGRGRLEDGASVRFRVAETDKGPQAEDVTTL